MTTNRGEPFVCGDHDAGKKSCTTTHISVANTVAGLAPILFGPLARYHNRYMNATHVAS
jgi:hypothetical protein